MYAIHVVVPRTEVEDGCPECGGLSALVKDHDQTMSLPLEMQDTFGLYGEETLERVIGLNRSDVDAVPPALRASLVFYQAANGRKLVPFIA